MAPTAREVRECICPELISMLRAVDRFEQLRGDEATSTGGATVDLRASQDSALLHARKLVEFAASSPDTTATSQWALCDILGVQPRKVPGRLLGFLDDAVLRMNDEHDTEWKWPKDVDGDRIDSADPNRFSKLADLVLKVLRPKHRTTTLETEAGAVYVEVLDRARDYFEQRTADALQTLTDSSAADKRP